LAVRESVSIRLLNGGNHLSARVLAYTRVGPKKVL
jgi:hypothetical protein